MWPRTYEVRGGPPGSHGRVARIVFNYQRPCKSMIRFSGKIMPEQGSEPDPM